MSSLKQRIKDDMKAAMRAKDKDRLGIVRMIQAAIKQIEVDERVELDDERVIVVLDKMLKQRRESIKQYNEAGREDLSAVEEAEVLVIKDFLPKPLTADEIDAMVVQAVSDCAAESIKDMGKVMAILKPQMLGRADMSAVGSVIKSKLGA